MENVLSSELCEYLRKCGFSKKRIDKLTYDTRLYHDLGVYGDLAEGCLEILCDQYHVDLSKFEFDKYFPREFVGENAFVRTLLWAVPFLGSGARRHGDYSVLTLGMVENAIRAKCWR
ncbi:DUF1493 family protein [Burkholderia lata]|uniref:DUF1493 family protein n=1 Tax=Burkholderia lata (strain ATCC 17760 / DSM 23089 / LMG 22485 / NCIMB 9086 / R18194 / 383) TaxID=482957 RepID=UPI0015833B2C|nr:DUF1493 family protein [Burkholderia lata]